VEKVQRALPCDGEPVGPLEVPTVSGGRAFRVSSCGSELLHLARHTQETRGAAVNRSNGLCVPARDGWRTGRRIGRKEAIAGASVSDGGCELHANTSHRGEQGETVAGRQVTTSRASCGEPSFFVERVPQVMRRRFRLLAPRWVVEQRNLTVAPKSGRPLQAGPGSPVF
jgi:hypothetical protein